MNTPTYSRLIDLPRRLLALLTIGLLSAALVGAVLGQAIAPLVGPGMTSAAALPATASGSPALDTSTAVQRAMGSVLRIETHDGSGTGFVVSQQGRDAIFVTNAHVVGAARAVTVIAPDGREHPARILARDQATDLAIGIVPNLTTVPPLRWGDPTALRLAQPLLVVGFALGAKLPGDPSVTVGVVSGRRMLGEVDYIQTDAAINPGNSGGPVLNAAGEVVGIATATIDHVGDRIIQGLHFAVPADLARAMVERLTA